MRIKYTYNQGLEEMLAHSSKHDISDDLLVQRYRDGIRIVKPRHRQVMNGLRVAKLYQLAAPVYFLNQASQMLAVNEATAELVGRHSIRDTLGRTAEDFCSREFGSLCLANDKSVIEDATVKVTEESGYRNDESLIQVLSFKFPWYYQEQVVGLLGCSIYLNTGSLHSFANTIANLSATGLLDTSQDIKKITMNQGSNTHVYFTNRETSIAKWIVQGKTLRETALLLGLSPRTVQNYFENMKCKVGVDSKSAFIEIMLPFYYS